MGDITPLFEYDGTCLQCGKTWRVTEEQLEVACKAEVLFSPCCEQPATIVRRGKKRDQKNMHSL